MWTYIKQSFMAFFYLLFMITTSYAISVLEEKFFILQIVLAIANLLLYFVILAGASFKDGEQALKVRNVNDLKRQEIIRTGEDIKLKIHEEYAPWKGFLAGFIACVPLILCLIIHSILLFSGSSVDFFGQAAGIIYNGFFVLVRIFSDITPYSYYWALLCIPFIVGLSGVPYMLGARKIELQQERIKETHKLIHGE